MKIVTKKNTYLLLLLVISLLGVVLSTTYAKFPSNYVTDDDIVGMSLDFNIGITNIEEYEEVEVAMGETLTFNVEIENITSNTMYYGIWYKMIIPNEITSDISIGRLIETETTTSGSIDSNSSKNVTIGIINNSDSDIKINIGVGSSNTSTSDIEYLNGRQLITGTVKINTNMLLSEYVQNLYNDGSVINTVNIGGDTSNPTVSLNATQGIMLDNNGEYRYYGANPNNYVSYNDELWRIISVSNVKSSTTDTVGETRVKIIRDESIGYLSWDSSDSTVNSGNGVNDWTQADLMTELNTLYYNSTSGTCYTGWSNASTECDFTNTGLSADARNLTEDAVYYLGGTSLISGLYADDYYTFERGTTVYDCSTDDGACPRATSWTGRVGIIYPSDYAFATDLSLCTKDGNNYDTDGCYNNDWIYDSSIGNQWALSPNYGFAYTAFIVYSEGFVTTHSVSDARTVRPVVYLRSEATIVGGEGTSSNPYQLSDETASANVFTETILAPNAQSDKDIDFSQTSEATNTNGIYLRSGTENDTYPIYYYRGNVNNNLIFADTCWKVVRTTETGGLKLLYNGIPTNGQCDNSGESTQIGTIAFNTAYWSPAYAGYMYSNPYTTTNKVMDTITDSYVYGNDVTYSNGVYTLVNTITNTWSNIYASGLINNHYTCFSTGTTCESVSYIYQTNSQNAYYIILTDGINIESALNNTLNYNTTSSTIKGDKDTTGTLDNWYYTNILQTGYDNYIEDTVWCNDRSINSLGGFNPDGGITDDTSQSAYLIFSTFSRLNNANPSLKCNRNNDKFTVSELNGNGALNYPIGLLTLDEVALAGGKLYTANTSYYLYNGTDYWVGSPIWVHRFLAFESYIENDGKIGYNNTGHVQGVRPSVSLKPGFSLTGNGDGSVSNPYVVS